MPDMTMCTSLRPDAKCPMREQCYRYTATPNEFRQSYFTEAPFVIAQGETYCEYYGPDTGTNSPTSEQVGSNPPGAVHGNT